MGNIRVVWSRYEVRQALEPGRQPTLAERGHLSFFRGTNAETPTSSWPVLYRTPTGQQQITNLNWRDVLDGRDKPRP